MYPGGAALPNGSALPATPLALDDPASFWVLLDSADHASSAASGSDRSSVSSSASTATRERGTAPPDMTRAWYQLHCEDAWSANQAFTAVQALVQAYDEEVAGRRTNRKGVPSSVRSSASSRSSTERSSEWLNEDGTLRARSRGWGGDEGLGGEAGISLRVGTLAIGRRATHIGGPVARQPAANSGGARRGSLFTGWGGGKGVGAKGLAAPLAAPVVSEPTETQSSQPLRDIEEGACGGGLTRIDQEDSITASCPAERLSVISEASGRGSQGGSQSSAEMVVPFMGHRASRLSTADEALRPVPILSPRARHASNIPELPEDDSIRSSPRSSEVSSESSAPHHTTVNIHDIVFGSASGSGVPRQGAAAPAKGRRRRRGPPPPQVGRRRLQWAAAEARAATTTDQPQRLVG